MSVMDGRTLTRILAEHLCRNRAWERQRFEQGFHISKGERGVLGCVMSLLGN